MFGTSYLLLHVCGTPRLYWDTILVLDSTCLGHNIRIGLNMFVTPYLYWTQYVCDTIFVLDSICL